MVQNYLKE